MFEFFQALLRVLFGCSPSTARYSFRGPLTLGLASQVLRPATQAPLRGHHPSPTRPPARPHLGHDHVLALLDVLALGLDDGVQEVQVLHVAPVGGQQVHEVLQHGLADLGAELVVVQEDVLHGLCLQQLRSRCGSERRSGSPAHAPPRSMPRPAPRPAPHPWREEEVQVLVQQGLVARVPRTELLQELVCVA